jgi:uncharacterized protein with PIN domain
LGNAASRKNAALQRHLKIRSKEPSLVDAGSPPRFVADVMLGRLAKWLRIAGFDVLYSNRFSDDELVRLSSGEGRILLSRDTRLLVRRVVSRFIFLESEDVRAQLRQVLRSTRITHLPALLSRCLSCNEPLAEVPRESVSDLVPAYVFRTQSNFKACPSCRKIYWAGTHRQSVMRTLEKLLSENPGS